MGKRSRDWHDIFHLAGGLLYWKHREGSGHKCVPGKLAGAIRRGRYSVTVDKRRYICARIIWEMANGQSIPDGMVVDHIDRNPLNNHPSNLRIATVAQNGWNSVLSAPRPSPRPQSSVRGVSWHADGLWQVRFRKNGKSIHIGAYHDLSEAELSAKTAMANLFGEFAPKEVTHG